MSSRTVIAAFLRREMILFLTGRGDLVVTLLLPAILAVVFGWALGNVSQPSEAPHVLVVQQDDSPEARWFVEYLAALPGMSVRVAPNGADEAPAPDKAVLIVLSGFARFVRAPAADAGSHVPLRLRVANARSDTATAIRAAIGATLAAFVAAERNGAWNAARGSPPSALRLPVSAPIPLEVVAGASQPSPYAHTLPGMAIFFVLFTGMTAAMNIERERRTSVWARIHAAPVSTPAVVTGLAGGVFLRCIIQLTVLLAFGAAAFGLWIRGGWLPVILTVAGTAALVAGFALLMAGIGRSEAQIHGVAQLIVIPVALLGGAVFPVDRFPAWLQPVARLTPVWWAVETIERATTGSLTAGWGLDAAVMVWLWALAVFLVGLLAFRVKMLE